MTRFTSPRLILALGLLTVFSGAIVAQQRSSSQSMTTAATSFLASLTPEQRQQATFAFDSAERLRWHFVPQFERNGLQIKAMTEPQRKLAHELLKTGLSDRGYTTYTQIMQLENILRDVEKGERPDARSGRLSVLGVRHAVGQGHMGLARRVPSHLAALLGRERHGDLRARRRLPARTRPK